jgi:hypothetical protein
MKNLLVVGVLSLVIAFGVLDASEAAGHRSIAAINWPTQEQWAERHGQQSKTVRSSGLMRGARPEKKIRAQSDVATQYVNVYTYQDASCSTAALVFAMGTGICVTVSNASNNATSYMYNYNATANVVNMNFYSDTACTTFLQDTNSMDLNNLGTENSCASAGATSEKYSIDDTLFTFPDLDGVYEE